MPIFWVRKIVPFMDGGEPKVSIEGKVSLPLEEFKKYFQEPYMIVFFQETSEIRQEKQEGGNENGGDKSPSDS